MTTASKQYALETSWSTRVTDEIVLQSIDGSIPKQMESSILQNITEINKGKTIPNIFRTIAKIYINVDI